MELLMKVAICDDEISQLKLMESYVKAWAKNKNEIAEVYQYQRAEHFLFQWEEQGDIDILLLDIEMPGMNGMEMAKKLREGQDGIQIIFVTGNPQYALEGYEVEPVTYLMKPVKEKKLWTALDRAVERSGKKSPVLLVEEAGGIVRVPIKEILYLESEGHDTLIKTEVGTIRSKKGMQEMEQIILEMVREEAFCKIHRSYLVSTAQILRISRKEVELYNHEKLPIARGKWAMVNQTYLAYYRREMEQSLNE